VGVNVSQFMCLGRFSAATFQVSCSFIICRGKMGLRPSSWPCGSVCGCCC
jgi:hypothetical protein